MVQTAGAGGWQGQGSPVIGTAPAERDTKPDKSKVKHQRRRFVSTSAKRPAAVRLRRGGWRSTSSSSSRRRLRRGGGGGGGGGEGAHTGPAEEAPSAREACRESRRYAIRGSGIITPNSIFRCSGRRALTFVRISLTGLRHV